MIACAEADPWHHSHACPPLLYTLPDPRFARRRPFLSSVGRLDKDTSGLLVLTDDGQLVHRINSPKHGIWKVREGHDLLTENEFGELLLSASAGPGTALCQRGDTCHP